jgi:hypothetical protein
MHVHVADQHGLAAAGLVFSYIRNKQRVRFHVTAFAVDFDLDEVIGDGFRKTENSRRRFMDLAKRSLAAGVDTGTRTVAGARAEVPGDQGIFRRGAGSRACRHAGADFPEPPHLAGSVTQEQRVEDVEAQQAGSAVVGQRVFVERLENLPPKPAIAEERASIPGGGQFRYDGIEADEFPTGREGLGGGGGRHAALLLDRQDTGVGPRRAAEGRRPAAFRPRVRHSARSSKQEIG